MPTTSFVPCILSYERYTYEPNEINSNGPHNAIQFEDTNVAELLRKPAPTNPPRTV